MYGVFEKFIGLLYLGDVKDFKNAIVMNKFFNRIPVLFDRLNVIVR